MTASHTRPAPPRQGLTLIEVLLALAIMLLALAAIGQLVDIGSDRGQLTQMQTRGTRLAQAKLAEVEAGAIAIDTGGTGTFDDDPAWSWSVEPSPAGPPNLYQVTVRVSREFQGKTFEVTLAQMMFDPSKMGSAAQAERPATETDTGSGGTTP